MELQDLRYLLQKSLITRADFGEQRNNIRVIFYLRNIYSPIKSPFLPKDELFVGS
jgi:hypothetical protein